MLKESKIYTTNGDKSITCQIRIQDTDYQIFASGVGVDKVEAFRQALIKLTELTTLNNPIINYFEKHK